MEHFPGTGYVGLYYAYFFLQNIFEPQYKDPWKVVIFLKTCACNPGKHLPSQWIKHQTLMLDLWSSWISCDKNNFWNAYSSTLFSSCTQFWNLIAYVFLMFYWMVWSKLPWKCFWFLCTWKIQKFRPLLGVWVEFCPSSLFNKNVIPSKQISLQECP